MYFMLSNVNNVPNLAVFIDAATDLAQIVVIH